MSDAPESVPQRKGKGRKGNRYSIVTINTFNRLSIVGYKLMLKCGVLNNVFLIGIY